MNFAFPNPALVAVGAIIKNRPDVITRFIRAYVRGMHRARTDPAFTYKAMAKYTKIEDTAVLQKAYEFYMSKVLEKAPYINMAGVQNVLDDLVKTFGCEKRQARAIRRYAFSRDGREKRALEGTLSIRHMARSFIFSALLLVAVTTVGGGVAHAQQNVAASYPGIAGYNIPFWVALDAGEFKKAGLAVDPVMISGGSKSVQNTIIRRARFAHVSGGVSVQANLSGADVTILTTRRTRCPPRHHQPRTLELSGSAPAKRSVSQASAVITISVYAELVKKNGINPDKDVTFLQMGGERNRLTALERGAIAATIMSPPGLFVAEAQGYSRLGDLNAMGMRYPELSIVGRKRDLKERRDLVRRYLRAYLESVRVMKGNRDLTVRVIEKYIHVGSKTEALKTYDYFVKSISDTLRTEREGITEFLATLETKTRCRNAIPTNLSISRCWKRR